MESNIPFSHLNKPKHFVKSVIMIGKIKSIMALTLDEAYFHDAITVSDMRKDATAIVAFLK